MVENMSRVVCALLVRGFGRRITSPDFWKVSIRINSLDTSEDGKILLGVLIANRYFPTADFVSWPMASRQEYMLQFVERTLREVFAQRHIDVSAIEHGVRFVVDNNFTNLIVGKRMFRSPRADEVAHIECEQRMDHARIYVVFESPARAVDRVFVASTVPEEFIFQSYFGQVEWDDSSQAVLRRVDGSFLPIDRRTTSRESQVPQVAQ